MFEIRIFLMNSPNKLTNCNSYSKNTIFFFSRVQVHLIPHSDTPKKSSSVVIEISQVKNYL